VIFLAGNLVVASSTSISSRRQGAAAASRQAQVAISRAAEQIAGHLYLASTRAAEQAIFSFPSAGNLLFPISRQSSLSHQQVE